MARELPKVYEPQQVESKIYDMWQQGGYFHAEVDESKKPFTIVMPHPTSPVSCTWVTPWTRHCRTP